MREFMLAVCLVVVMPVLAILLILYLNRRLEEAFLRWSKTTGQKKWKIIAVMSMTFVVLLMLAILPGIAIFGGGWKGVGDFVQYKDGDVGMLIYGHLNLPPAMANYYLMGAIVLGLPLVMVVFTVIAEPAMFLAGRYRFVRFTGSGRWVAPSRK